LFAHFSYSEDGTGEKSQRVCIDLGTEESPFKIGKDGFVVFDSTVRDAESFRCYYEDVQKLCERDKVRFNDLERYFSAMYQNLVTIREIRKMSANCHDQNTTSKNEGGSTSPSNNRSRSRSSSPATSKCKSKFHCNGTNRPECPAGNDGSIASNHDSRSDDEIPDLKIEVDFTLGAQDANTFEPVIESNSCLMSESGSIQESDPNTSTSTSTSTEPENKVCVIFEDGTKYSLDVVNEETDY